MGFHILLYQEFFRTGDRTVSLLSPALAVGFNYLQHHLGRPVISYSTFSAHYSISYVKYFLLNCLLLHPSFQHNQLYPILIRLHRGRGLFLSFPTPTVPFLPFSLSSDSIYTRPKAILFPFLLCSQPLKIALVQDSNNVYDPPYSWWCSLLVQWIFISFQFKMYYSSFLPNFPPNFLLLPSGPLNHSSYSSSYFLFPIQNW